MSVPRWSATSKVLLKVRIVLEVVPARRPRDEDQVPRRRDGQQLGRALGDAEDEGLPVGELSRGLPYAQRCQHDREKKRRAGER